MVGLFVFGGTDPETNVGRYVDAFVDSFSKELCIAAWEAVGAVPPTRACLNNKKVSWELGNSDSNHKIQRTMREMQFANTLSCDLLITRGFKGELLKAEIKRSLKFHGHR